jgi:6-phosphogluconolactonase
MRYYSGLPVVLMALTVFPAGAADMRVYVGCSSGGRGLSVADFNSETGSLGKPRHAIDSPSPTYLAVHPDGLHLYAANAGGFLSAFAIDSSTGNLSLLNQTPSSGQNPAYISLDGTAKHILAANYGSGNVGVWDVQPDFTIGKRTAWRWQTGGQGSPSGEALSHSIRVDPANRFAVAAALGFDRLFVYRFKAEDGSLGPGEPPSIHLSKGSGPRHVVFHGNGQWVYVANETGNTVAALSWDAEHGVLTPLQTITTLPAGLRGASDVAEIEVHPNGRFLYASNRGHDSIAAFAIDPASGKLTALGHTPSRGKLPRNFRIDPTGKWLLVTNYKSGNAAVFRIDAGGMLKPQGEPVTVPDPYGIGFVAAGR